METILCRWLHGEGGGGCSRQPGLCDGLYMPDPCQVVDTEPARYEEALIFHATTMQSGDMIAVIPVQPGIF